MSQIWTHDASTDEIHLRLKTLVQVPVTNYLWSPADAITFVPYVLDTVFGDGRALFRITTVNDRPAHWIVRGDSGWQTQECRAPDDAPDFGDFSDDILTAIEDQFGSARCGESGNNLREPASERIAFCQCEECSDPDYIAVWPSIDDDGGCLWSRMEWPSEFSTIDHPWWRGNLLAIEEEAAFSPGQPRMAHYWLRREIERLSL